MDTQNSFDPKLQCKNDTMLDRVILPYTCIFDFFWYYTVNQMVHNICGCCWYVCILCGSQQEYYEIKYEKKQKNYSRYIIKYKKYKRFYE